VYITYDLKELNTELLDVLSKWEGGRNVRNSYNALELAKLYPLWYLQKLKRLPVSVSLKYKKKVFVSMPKLRYFKKTYYAWLKHLEIPKLNWVLITLTLSRDIPIQDAWANFGSWVSDFLRRFRVYLKKRYGFEQFTYLWVIEAHEDGYPHLHLLVSFPFVRVELIHSWWKDTKEGNPLSAFQGVDVKFIGRDTENIKAYLLKYLVKGHHKYWSFSLNGSKCTVRLSTLFLWYFRVRLFAMSRHLSKVKVSSSQVVIHGFIDISHFYRAYYKSLGIAFSDFYRCFYDAGTLEKDTLLLSLSQTFRNKYS
jgi:hypothetical protein